MGMEIPQLPVDIEGCKALVAAPRSIKTTNMILEISGMNDPVIGWDKYIWASTKLETLFPYEIKSYT